MHELTEKIIAELDDRFNWSSFSGFAKHDIQQTIDGVVKDSMKKEFKIYQPGPGSWMFEGNDQEIAMEWMYSMIYSMSFWQRLKLLFWGWGGDFR
jgi:hypothetical protein